MARWLVRLIIVFTLLVSILPIAAQDACTVSTRKTNIRLRGGPSTTDVQVGVMPANTDILVIGRFRNRNRIWFRLLRDQAAPTSTAENIWVASNVVTVKGNCDAIPLDNPPTTSGGGGTTTSGGGGGTAAIDPTKPQPGTWDIVVSPDTFFSCQGIAGSLSIPSDTIFGPSYSSPLTLNADGSFVFDGSLFVVSGSNEWVSSITTRGSGAPITAQMYLKLESPQRMTGQVKGITSYNGVSCSLGANVVITRR